MKALDYRYLPQRPLPAYVFIPGKNPHPKKSGGHMEGLSDPVVPPITDPASNETLRFALDLFNGGYFWESHVYFEALWNAHHRQGSVADFLKGLIKLGAAGVKLQLGQDKLVREHLARAKELFEGVKASEGEEFLGFDLIKLVNFNLDHHSRIDPVWN